MGVERDILEYVNYAEEDERLESRVQVQRGVDAPLWLRAYVKRGAKRGELDPLACDADALLSLIDRCAGYVRRFTRWSIPRAAGRSSEERGFWVTHLTWRRKPMGTAAWWESENGQKMRMAGTREAHAIG